MPERKVSSRIDVEYFCAMVKDTTVALSVATIPEALTADPKRIAPRQRLHMSGMRRGGNRMAQGSSSAMVDRGPGSVLKMIVLTTNLPVAGLHADLIYGTIRTIAHRADQIEKQLGKGPDRF